MQTLSPFVIAILISLLALSACGTGSGNSSAKTSGGRSAVFTTDTLSIEGAKNVRTRHSATLGVFVSEYLSQAASSTVMAQGGLMGVEAQSVVLGRQQNVTDPDFELLQAFQEALSVDIADLLNRSQDRAQALDTYMESLKNVAARANDREKELSATAKDLASQVKILGRERDNADRDVKTSLKAKEYEKASEAQKTLNEKAAQYAEISLKARQVNDIVSTLDELLSLYGQKRLAIEQNREALLSGLKIIDVPGIDELKIIERTKGRSSTTKKSGDTFNYLFQGTGLR